MRGMWVAAAALLVVAGSAAPSAARAAATSNPPPPAHSLVLHDGPGDVWTFSDVTVGYQPADQPAADVLRARVTHGTHAVGTRMVLDDLQRIGIQWFYVDVHTAGVTSWFILEARAGNRQGTVYQDVQGEWVRMPGIGHRIDYAADRVTLRIPRTMLGAPPWVRVRMRTVLRLPDATFFTDNPTTSGPDADFTPRVPAPVPASAA